jgi:tetratricopeptide (TPR) repeat protein
MRRGRGDRVTPSAIALALALAVVACAPPARAQPDAELPASPNMLAIEKGNAALQAFDKGDWAGALALFREADRLYHSPVLLLYAARSLDKLERLLEAREAYRALARERLDAAPVEWEQAQRDGATELAALERQIPTLTVIVHGARPTTRASIDGRDVAPGVPVELDPAEHRCSVSHEGRVEERLVRLARGDRSARAIFDRGRAPERPALVPPPVPPPARGPFLPGIVMAAAGGAAVIAGAIVGALALGEAGAADDALPASCDADRACPTFEEGVVEPTYDTARTLAHIADGLLFGGAAVAATGVVLWIVDPRGEAAAAALDGARVRVRF